MKKSMKRNIRGLGIGLLAAMIVTGCGGKAKGVSDDELVSKDVFEGTWLITADAAKEKVGADGVLFVDCRGNGASDKETIEGADATDWKLL